MIDKAFYLYIKNDLSVSNLFYGSAENQTPPYIVMFKVADLEDRQVLCDTQGNSGEALFQFSAYLGGEGDATDAAATVTYLNAIKNLVKDIKGVIGSAPDDYRINYNKTSGVNMIGEGTNTLRRWGAIFETIIRWEKI